MPAKGTPAWIWLVLGILVGAIFLGGTQFSIAGKGSNDSHKDKTVSCAFARTLEVKAVDMYNPATEVTAEAVLFAPDSAGKGSPIADDESTNISYSACPGEQFVLYVGDDGQTTAIDGSSVTLDASNDWYWTVKNVTVGNGATTIAKVELVKEGTLTVTVKNEDGSVNGASNEQALGTGEVISLDMELKASNDSAFGNPNAPADHGIVICFDYNTTEIKNVDVSGGTRTEVPLQYSGYEKCYKMDFTSLKDLEKKTIVVEIEAKSDADPSASDISYAILDPNMYYDSDLDAFTWGVEDEDGQDIGATNVTGTIYIS